MNDNGQSRDDCFLENLREWLGRDTTQQEDDVALNLRNDYGYSMKEIVYLINNDIHPLPK